MKLPLLLILTSLISVGASAATAGLSEPMTLKCDTSYMFWKDPRVIKVGNPVITKLPSIRMKLPKVAPPKTLWTYYAALTQKTDDGQYEISIIAGQIDDGPRKVGPYFVSATIYDLKNNTGAAGNPTPDREHPWDHDIDTSKVEVFFNPFGHKNFDVSKPSGSLSVRCELVR
jgi:hypothetical protein